VQVQVQVQGQHHECRKRFQIEWPWSQLGWEDLLKRRKVLGCEEISRADVWWCWGK
jgi:hypothetical protein